MKKQSKNHVFLRNRKDLDTFIFRLQVTEAVIRRRQSIILEGTKPTTKSGEIGTPIRVENIINADFIRKENLICRLFLYEDEGKYFIEQTDNGVYTISKEDYDLIENYMEGN